MRTLTMVVVTLLLPLHVYATEQAPPQPIENAPQPSEIKTESPSLMRTDRATFLLGVSLFIDPKLSYENASLSGYSSQVRYNGAPSFAIEAGVISGDEQSFLWAARLTAVSLKVNNATINIGSLSTTIDISRTHTVFIPQIDLGYRWNMNYIYGGASSLAFDGIWPSRNRSVRFR